MPETLRPQTLSDHQQLPVLYKCCTVPRLPGVDPCGTGALSPVEGGVGTLRAHESVKRFRISPRWRASGLEAWTVPPGGALLAMYPAHWTCHGSNDDKERKRAEQPHALIRSLTSGNNRC